MGFIFEMYRVVLKLWWVVFARIPGRALRRHHANARLRQHREPSALPSIFYELIALVLTSVAFSMFLMLSSDSSG